MSPDQVQTALAEIRAETDLTVKHLRLASLCTALFATYGIDLVVVGGSAIEFYTEGAYTSGDVDLCIVRAREPLTIRRRQEIMGRLGGRGGPRSWEVAGTFVDVLGTFENLARTGVRTIVAPLGPVKIAPVEELIVERILVSRYPQDYPPARDCARKLLVAALQAEVEVNWNEVRRLSRDPAYANWSDVKALTHEQAKALKIRGPYDSDG